MSTGLENISTGKNDKPFLLMDPTVALTYDINNIDGMFYMLDKNYQGCQVFPFSKPIDVDKGGTVQVDGHDAYYFIKSLANAGGIFMLGIDVVSYLTEYNQTIEIFIADFYDTDGNQMDEVRLTLTAESNLDGKTMQLNEQEIIALEAAQESIVLLKNDNQALPLSRNEQLNIFGTAFHKYRTSTVGAGKINPRFTINFKEGIAQYSEFQLNTAVADLYKFGREVLPDEAILQDAKQRSGTGIVVISRASGENFDNSTNPGEYYLTDDEKALITCVSDNFDQSILILNVGYPIDMSFISRSKIDAIVYSGYGGMHAGRALVEVLDGRITPSAKLPFTWSFDYDDHPASKNFYNSIDGKIPLGADDNHLWINTFYEEDLYIGYRYFETFHQPVAFPFGHGLSYTSFTSDVTSFTQEDTGVALTVRVKNIGKASGKEVAQVYVKKQTDNLETPAIELVEFLKTDVLAPQDEQVIQVEIPLERMAIFDESSSQYVIDSGDYQFCLGNDVTKCEEIGTIHLTEAIVLKKVDHLLTPNQPLETLSKSDAVGTYPKGLHSGINEGATALEPRAKRKSYSVEFEKIAAPQPLLFPDVVADPSKIQAFVSQFSLEELARIVICGSHGWGMEGIGEAGRVYKLTQYDLPDFIVSDGNSGININEKNIGMPSSVSVSASFSKSLAEKVGHAIGLEAKKRKVQLILAPGFNIQRNPLNGRHPEYFSEDPFLSGTMAGYYCKGLESTGVGGCYKHFIANNAESARKRNQSVLSERALRDIYIKNFEVALSVHHPHSVMTAYNAVNGVETSADPELLQGILRDELGFKGFIMTDWSSDSEVDFIDMLIAGNNWITPGSNDSTYTDKVIEAVKNDRLPIEMLQTSAAYILSSVAKISKNLQ